MLLKLSSPDFARPRMFHSSEIDTKYMFSSVLKKKKKSHAENSVFTSVISKTKFTSTLAGYIWKCHLHEFSGWFGVQNLHI